MDDTQNAGAVTEIEIVDTFTKLIFGDSGAMSDREMAVIEALRQVEAEVSVDDLVEMGAYLRALGVAEMIRLVPRVQEQLQLGTVLRSPSTSPAAPSGRRSLLR